MQHHKAVFFDRDGTLIKDMNYLMSLKYLEFLPGTVELCRWFLKQGYFLFVVTNQSGVARGYFDEEFVVQTHRTMNQFYLSQEIFFRGWFYCPHHPEQAIRSQYRQECFCRKPKPGMLIKAADWYNIDLSQSIMVGDRQSDLETGYAVGCRSFLISSLLGRTSAELHTIIESSHYQTERECVL